MHVDKIFESIQRDGKSKDYMKKFSKEMEKHLGRYGKKGLSGAYEGFMEQMYETMNGPHFDEESATEVVENMKNEDGSKGSHWSLEETTNIANQYGVNLAQNNSNKHDWFVVLNMMWSDYYKVIVSITNSENTKYFVELAKAWLFDNDVPEGKTWRYFTKVVNCDEEEFEDDEDEREYEHKYRHEDRYKNDRNEREREMRERQMHHNKYGREYNMNGNYYTRLR